MNYLIVNNRCKLDGSIRYIHSFAFISHQNIWIKIVVSLYSTTEMIQEVEKHMKIWKSVDPKCIHFHFVWFFGSPDFRFTCISFKTYSFFLIPVPGAIPPSANIHWCVGARCTWINYDSCTGTHLGAAIFVVLTQCVEALILRKKAKKLRR